MPNHKILWLNVLYNVFQTEAESSSRTLRSATEQSATGTGSRRDSTDDYERDESTDDYEPDESGDDSQSDGSWGDCEFEDPRNDCQSDNSRDDCQSDDTFTYTYHYTPRAKKGNRYTPLLK